MQPVDQELILEQQFEEYRYIRSKAWSLIQLFIASSAVLAAFATSEVVNFVLGALRRIETSGRPRSGQPNDLILEIAEPLALVISMFAALYVLKSFFSLRELMQVPRLQPGTSAEQESTLNADSDMDVIISKNGDRINTMNDLLRTSLSEFGMAGFYLITSVLIIFTVDHGLLSPVYFFVIAAGLTGVKNIVNFVRILIGFVRGNPPDIKLEDLLEEGHCLV